MSQLVERVRGHLKKQAIEQALGALIDAWHDTRAPAIADAIDVVDALEPAPEPPETTAWIAAARAAKRHRERGALLRTIMQRSSGDIAMVMTIAIALRWDDPRLTTRIVELLTTIPFSGKRTREVWRAVFEAAKAQRDPRFLTVAKTLPPTWNVGDDTKTFLTNRLKEVTVGLVEPPLPADVVKALAALATEIAPPTQPANTTSLLDAIYANPDDDTARAVYADWLQEQGDPRGEFIALQLLPDDKRDRKAEQALIKKYKKQWLGPLATVLVGDVEFRRGFVAKATARFRHQRDAEQIGTLPEWATLEELAFNPSGARDDQEQWTRYVDPAMCGLRVARFPDVGWVLAASGRPWRIEELWIATDDDGVRDICVSSLLPKLRHLVVRGPEPTLLAELPTCPPHLTVVDGRGLRDEARRRAWFTGAEKLPLERFTILWFGAGELHHHFTRDTKGKLTRLDVEIRNAKHEEPTEYEIREITTELEALAGTLTHFDARFVHGGESRPIPELVRATKRAKVIGG